MIFLLAPIDAGLPRGRPEKVLEREGNGFSGLVADNYVTSAQVLAAVHTQNLESSPQVEITTSQSDGRCVYIRL